MLNIDRRVQYKVFVLHLFEYNYMFGVVLVLDTYVLDTLRSDTRHVFNIKCRHVFNIKCLLGRFYLFFGWLVLSANVFLCVCDRTPMTKDFPGNYNSDEWNGYINDNDRVLLKVVCIISLFMLF